MITYKMPLYNQLQVIADKTPLYKYAVNDI
jgi:hypothetical protein